MEGNGELQGDSRAELRQELQGWHLRLPQNGQVVPTTIRQMKQQEAHGASKDTRLIQGLPVGSLEWVWIIPPTG